MAQSGFMQKSQENGGSSDIRLTFARIWLVLGAVLVPVSTSGAARLRWHRRCLGDQSSWRRLYHHVLQVAANHEARVVDWPTWGLTCSRATISRESRHPDMMGLQKSQAQALEYTRHFLEYTRRNPWTHARRPLNRRVENKYWNSVLRPDRALATFH